MRRCLSKTWREDYFYQMFFSLRTSKVDSLGCLEQQSATLETANARCHIWRHNPGVLMRGGQLEQIVSLYSRFSPLIQTAILVLRV